MGKLSQPYKDWLQPLSTEELEALKADIKLRGVLQPVIVDELGNILDGHHRYRCDKDASIVIVSGLSDGEKKAFVISSNNKRRNLSPDQKAENRKRSIEIAKELKAEDPKKWTQQKIATALGVSHETVSVWLETSNSNTGKASTDARVSIPPAKVEELVERVASGESQSQVAADLGVSQQRVSQIVAGAAKREEVRQQKQERVENPKGQYGLILCDPPWQYDFAETSNREIENQYPTMTVAELCELKLPADKDCLLLLWTTAPKLREAFACIDAWEFEYKTHAVWDKKKIGMGYWFRGQHELLLVATCGVNSPPAEPDRVSSIFSEARGKHSAKPECVYEWIEKAFPHLPKCEMFARSVRDGWYGWGNEV